MLKRFIAAAGWPRIIIGLFLCSLYVAAPFVGVRISTSLSDTLVRVGMNGILVLAMIPMVILYLIFQKQFIQGIAMTGGK